METETTSATRSAAAPFDLWARASGPQKAVILAVALVATATVSAGAFYVDQTSLAALLAMLGDVGL